MPDYEIREYQPGDEVSLLETFNHVFSANDPGYVPRTLEEWRWGFADNPHGWRIFVAVHEGRVVAQFAGQPLRVWVRGQEQVFVNCVDSMSHPDHRRGLKRPGLFVNVAHAYFDAYGGADRDWLHYGLPIEEAARMGDTFLRYEIVRNQPVVSRRVGEGPTELPAGVAVIDRFDEQARWLYDRCAGRWGASTIRDDTYLNWRFLDHPRFDYVALGVFNDQAILRGLAVYRTTDWFHDNMVFIVDWLVPTDEPEVGELLRRAVLARARAQRAFGVGILLPEWSEWFQMFQEDNWWVWPTDYSMRARWFHRDVRPEWLRENWWYQLAETDLM